jgi:hypothetical protein
VIGRTLTDADLAAVTDAQRSAVRLALGLDEAAAALGLSRDSFERHVLQHLAVVRIGRRRLIAVDELRRYLRDASTPPTAATLTGSAAAAAERPPPVDLSPRR